MTINDIIGNKFPITSNSPSTNIKHNNSSIKQKQLLPKVKGIVNDNIFVESVLIDNAPKFLCKQINDNIIFVQDFIETDHKKYCPLEPQEYGYRPYSFSSAEIASPNSELSKSELLDDVKNLLDRYLVVRELDKNLVLGNIFVTYSMEWITTLHYLYFVGETESGKSTGLHLGSWLNYRCLYGEDIPHADIYNFLGYDEEGAGTICEDEAQELDKEKSKIRTYKNSYSIGSKKAVILNTDNKKRQVYYKTFCPKWFAGERLPQDKGFRERLAVINMIEGMPESNIKRVTAAEADKLNQTRNNLLLWKLQNMGRTFDRHSSRLQGRDQELWEDFLSIANNTKYFEKFSNVVTFYISQRHAAIHNSLEARLFKALLDKINENFELNFNVYWDYITNNNPNLPGSFDYRASKTFYPDDFTSRLTPYFLTRILEDKFHATKRSKRVRDEAGILHKITNYVFQKEILEKLTKKYGIELPIDSPLN